MGPREPALERAFFERQVVDVAPDLLGAVLVHSTPRGDIGLRLTEVEAYAGEADPGSHAHRGRTPRTEVMFGEPGFAYVYFSYGMHWCMNVVCGPLGIASAVLLRAGEVVVGADLAREARVTSRSDRDLAQGPARLCVALGINGALNASDLCGGGPMRLHHGPGRSRAVRTGPRVGVGGAGADTAWRFWLEGEPTVSSYRAHAPRRGHRQGSTS